MAEDRSGTAFTPPLSVPPCPALPGICEPPPLMVLLALLPVPPYCLLPLPGELVLFFFQGEGGEKGGESEILSYRGKGEIEKGQKQGRQRFVPS